ncbi:hypothetical protein EV138_1135 [Kribbella voronezhensis]|uniref:Uncharacterized protein n=1 Tax=Kribbella voronezhensis TaxID=2512212 RepID=A0A4R7T700_9ACTN|nr:hypothetical protein [Kribbella voronezhensis]TDU87611.1 hypothetical protein EV138_1135 [Kribbella voronezhensis]
MATAPRKRCKKTTDQTEALTPAQEYRAALEEFTSYSTNNETAEALDARDRLDRAETRRRWWHF